MVFANPGYILLLLKEKVTNVKELGYLQRPSSLTLNIYQQEHTIKNM